MGVVADDRQRLGKRGEELACRELRRRGYAILARRFRVRGGEIDIVARSGGVLVFVEVKCRSTERFGAPAEAVTARKRQRLRRLATVYLSQRFSCRALETVTCRFDVVEVVMGVEGRPTVRIIEGAFDGSG